MENKHALPEHARRVFKGTLFEVWQWEQEMYDGSTKIFERVKKFSTVDVIAVIGDKILIQEQEQPSRPKFLSLAGGRMEDDDSLAEAKRELLEETGCVSNDWVLWGEEEPSSWILYTNYTFIARNCEFVSEPKLDGGEKIKTNLIDFEEFLLLAENPLFHVPYSLMKALLRMRIYPKEKEAFYKLLFKK